MKIVFAAKKGGQGKTTLATNFAGMLAAAGRDVLLVDCEKDGGASLWQAIRTRAKHQPAVTYTSAFGDTVHEEINRIAPKFDDVIIDTPGLDAIELRSAILAADILIAPVDIGILSTAKLGPLQEVIRQGKVYNPLLRCFIVPNRVHTHGTRGKAQILRLRATMDALSEFTLTDSYLCARAEISDVFDSGKMILEGNDDAAKREIRAILAEVCDGR